MAEDGSQDAPSRPAASRVSSDLTTPSKAAAPKISEKDKDQSSPSRVASFLAPKSALVGSAPGGTEVMSAISRPTARSVLGLPETYGLGPFPSHPTTSPSNHIKSDKNRPSLPAPREALPNLEEGRNNNTSTSSIVAASPTTKPGPIISAPRDNENRPATIPPQNFYSRDSGSIRALHAWSENLAKQSSKPQHQEGARRSPITGPIQRSRPTTEDITESTIARPQGRKDNPAPPTVSCISASRPLDKDRNSLPSRSDIELLANHILKNIVAKATGQKIPYPAHGQSTLNMGLPIPSAKGVAARNDSSSNTVTNKDKAPPKSTNFEPSQKDTPSSPARKIPEHRQPNKQLSNVVANNGRATVTSPQLTSQNAPGSLRPGITFGVGENGPPLPSPTRKPLTIAEAAEKYGKLNPERQLEFLTLLFKNTKPELKQQVLALARLCIKSPPEMKPNNMNAILNTQDEEKKNIIEDPAKALDKPNETQVAQHGLETLSDELSPKSKFLATIKAKEKIETDRLLKEERIEKQNPLKRSRYVFEQDQDSDENTWEVDEVLETRTRHEYLVSWKNRSLEQQEWVTANSFKHAMEARAMLQSRAKAAFGGSVVGGTIVVAPPSPMVIPEDGTKEKPISRTATVPKVSSPRSDVSSTPSPPPKRRARPSQDKTSTPINKPSTLNAPTSNVPSTVTKRPRRCPPKADKSQKIPSSPTARPVIQRSSPPLAARRKDTTIWRSPSPEVYGLRKREDPPKKLPPKKVSYEIISDSE